MSASPINLAAQDGHTEILKLLLQDKRFDPSVNDNRALLLATQANHTPSIKLLLSDPRVSVSSKLLFLSAAENNNLQIFSIFESRLSGELTVQDKNEIFILSIEKDSSEIIFYLISDRQVDPSFLSSCSIRKAAKAGNEQLVRFTFFFSFLSSPLLLRFVFFSQLSFFSSFL